jgi:hypothetical protein
MKRKANEEPQGKDDTVLAAFRMPRSLRGKAREKCTATDITFSQLMRRAIRREIEAPEETPAS